MNFWGRKLYLWNFNQKDSFITGKIISVILSSNFMVLKFNPKLKKNHGFLVKVERAMLCFPRVAEFGISLYRNQIYIQNKRRKQDNQEIYLFYFKLPISCLSFLNKKDTVKKSNSYFIISLEKFPYFSSKLQKSVCSLLQL